MSTSQPSKLFRRDFHASHRCAALHAFFIASFLGTVLFASPLPARGALPTLGPEQLGLSSEQLERIEDAVQKEIEAKRLPGAVVCVGRTGGVAYLKAFGRRQIRPEDEPMTTDTVFDMASLTKPTATATSIMMLVERGDVRIRNSVTEYIPEFDKHGKSQITVEHLLTHQSGLVPDNPLRDYQDGAEKAWERIFDLKTQQEPGTRFVYSDVNYLVLGELIRRVTGYDVAEFAAANIFRPLGMTDTTFCPGEKLSGRAAPTEQRDGKYLRGEVHDPRAALLDGVAGHAGLFSTATDMAIYADAMLRGACRGGGSPSILSHATIAEMLTPRNIRGQQRALGWDVRTGYSSNRGELFSSRAFGHGGFTGTAMWIDPELDLFVIFLSNRLHPDGTGSVNPLAGRIGTIAAAAIKGPNPLAAGSQSKAASDSAPSSSVSVLTGIDVLKRDGYAPIRGRRLGLITNHTGLDKDGNRTVDLLHDTPGLELISIFSPEHGIAGKLDHDNIGDEKDEKTGLPIFSLYNKSRRPTKEQLEDIDCLVFDIQDVGARFYTYMSTMAWAMEAAAEHGKRFVVLDRPNPIGGLEIEGPMRDENRDTFVGFHTIPLRHGMTVGELATMYRAEKKLDVDLAVVRTENWRRGDYWDATGLMWVNPSPNMRSLNQAVLYPGVGLIEFTNVSVGRGTDTPFEVVGAPWIDARQLARELNATGLAGVRFVPIKFTPNASKFSGTKCGGVNIVITDRAALKPVRMGLTIATTLRRLYADQWEVDNLDRLLMNKEILAAIRDGKDVRTLEAMNRAGLEKFAKRRAKHLLYAE